MNLRVFIVDDHEIVRAAIKQLLEEWGADICGEAASATEALEKLTLLAPDVVILDHLMRGMTGLETIQKVKEILSTIKIVLLTIDRAVVAEAYRSGADACVDKANARELHDALTKIALELRGPEGRYHP